MTPEERQRWQKKKRKPKKKRSWRRRQAMRSAKKLKKGRENMKTKEISIMKWNGQWQWYESLNGENIMKSWEKWLAYSMKKALSISWKWHQERKQKAYRRVSKAEKMKWPYPKWNGVKAQIPSLSGSLANGKRGAWHRNETKWKRAASLASKAKWREEEKTKREEIMSAIEEKKAEESLKKKLISKWNIMTQWREMKREERENRNESNQYCVSMA